MRTSRVLLAAVVVTALVPLWGYWYSIRHASLELRVDDYALKSPTQLYGSPHDVSLVLRDGETFRLHNGSVRVKPDYAAAVLTQINPENRDLHNLFPPNCLKTLCLQR